MDEETSYEESLDEETKSLDSEEEHSEEEEPLTVLFTIWMVLTGCFSWRSCTKIADAWRIKRAWDQSAQLQDQTDYIQRQPLLPVVPTVSLPWHLWNHGNEEVRSRVTEIGTTITQSFSKKWREHLKRPICQDKQRQRTCAQDQAEITTHRGEDCVDVFLRDLKDLSHPPHEDIEEQPLIVLFHNLKGFDHLVTCPGTSGRPSSADDLDKPSEPVSCTEMQGSQKAPVGCQNWPNSNSIFPPWGKPSNEDSRKVWKKEPNNGWIVWSECDVANHPAQVRQPLRRMHHNHAMVC